MITRVSDVMTEDVETVQSTETLKEAAKKMRDCNIGALPVYMGSVLTGFVTDRDITVKATAKGVDPSVGKVEDVMTWKAEWCLGDADVKEAAHIMETKKVRRLAVLDRAGYLIGLLSVDDIARRAHDSKSVEKVVEATAAHTASEGYEI